MEKIAQNRGQRIQPLFPGPIQPLFPGQIHHTYRGPAVYVNKTRQSHANTAQRPSYSDVVRATTHPLQPQPPHHHNHHTHPRQPHRHNRHSQSRQPPQQQYRANDPSFAHLLKLLYRGTQLRHHANNWGTLPKPVEKKIKDLFQFLTPPVPTDELKSQLESIRSSIIHEIQTCILTHINTQTTINNKQLRERTINETDRDAARGLAERVIRRKYGRKASQQNLNAWLAADLSVMGQGTGTSTQSTNNAESIIQATESTNHTESSIVQITNNTSSDTPQTNRKRRRDSPVSTVSVSNRFSALTDNPDQTESVESEVLTDTDVTNPKKLLARSPQTIRNENTDANTSNNLTDHFSLQTDFDDTLSMPPPPQCDPLLASQPTISLNRLSLRNSFYHKQTLNKNVFIHDNKPKSNWKLNIKGSPNTVLITDSNFRLASHDIPIPDDWEIHVYPGSYFAHTANILKTATIPDCVKDVILAVGINHKNWKFETSTKRDLNKMVAEANRMNPNVHFLGVSTVDLPESIKAINESTRKTFGNHFIPALSKDQVTISPIDPFNIHHNKVTVEKIIKSIQFHLLNFYSELIPTFDYHNNHYIF
jgi:hypothetical protein